jgi:hypothetical protein
MKKTLAILATVATIGATVVTAPAEARGFGRFGGPGLAFGLAAGAIALGAAGAYGYYGPGYGYYGPPYGSYGPGYGYGGYRPYYGAGYYSPGYAYYGGPYGNPYWRQRYYQRNYW